MLLHIFCHISKTMQTKIAFYEKFPDKFLVYQTKEAKSDLGLYLIPVVHIKNKSICCRLYGARRGQAKALRIKDELKS